MKVILKEQVKNLGDIGQIVDVSNGYARNYLIPRGLAVEANVKNIRSLEHEKNLLQEKARKARNSAQELSNKLANMSIVIKAKAGEEGKLFGSITSMDIAEKLKNEGIEIDKKKIILDEPIKRLGKYSVNIKLFSDVTSMVNIEIMPE